MDGTINDFFNEIDQIAPPKESKNESVWQECLDNTSGYTYYWNIKTSEVTWEIPEEYKLWKEQTTHKSGNLLAAPKTAPLFPSANLSTAKIYKIQNDLQDDLKTIELTENCKSVVAQPSIKKQPTERNNKEDKIVLISSYGGDSESETETENHTRTVNIVKEEPVVLGPHLPELQSEQNNSNSNSQNNSDNEDDTDLLAKIQTRAKVLKDLGGELPPDVKKLVEQNGSDKKEETLQTVSNKDKKDVTGFSLVAGYGESDDEEEEEANVNVTFIKPTENKVSHSTLFPITKPIDITQFNEVKKEPDVDTDLIDSKVFQRKRRIGIELGNTVSRPEPYVNNKLDENTERQGLGFKKEKDSENILKSEIKGSYPAFKSGGVMFVKSDVLNPITSSSEPERREISNKEITDDSQKEMMKSIEETHKTLNEKLTFLSEGREAASPVQVMIIQMETLYEAMKAGSLTISYLHKWLKETCSELIKLEKDATPAGWLLQWDRINKRYYYRNQQTGHSQWEYPQPDIVGGDDAMDISTTPPPPPIDDVSLDSTPSISTPMQPPPPPRIKSPTPPPPPIISKSSKQKHKAKTHSNPPLPPEVLPILLPPLPTEKCNTHGEPLPPGVDSPCGSPPPPPSTVETTQTSDALGSALNSFYSDLAALETETNTSPTVTEIPQHVSESAVVDTTEVPAKKKKKTKVKLVQGLAMKKKGVSKLVERWKNVQKDYN